MMPIEAPAIVEIIDETLPLRNVRGEVGAGGQHDRLDDGATGDLRSKSFTRRTGGAWSSTSASRARKRAYNADKRTPSTSPKRMRPVDASHPPHCWGGAANCSGPQRWSWLPRIPRIRSSGTLPTGHTQVQPGLPKNRAPTKLPKAEPAI